VGNCFVLFFPRLRKGRQSSSLPAGPTGPAREGFVYALFAAVALVLPASTTAAPPAAMVLSTRGTVTLTRGHKPAQRLGTMDLLRPGDYLSASDNSQAMLVFFADGHRERLKPAARVRVAKDECQPVAGV